jgi:hypothetical protein
MWVIVIQLILLATTQKHLIPEILLNADGMALLDKSKMVKHY